MTHLVSNCKAVTIKRTFSRETAISIDIQASKSVNLASLTNASDYQRWNSTVSIDGTITKGKKIQLKFTIDQKRVFNLSINKFEADNRFVWGNAMGKRIYTPKSIGNGLTNFSLNEKLGGPIFPLFAKMIPSFNISFDQFASDLKKEAEINSNTK